MCQNAERWNFCPSPARGAPQPKQLRADELSHSELNQLTNQRVANVSIWRIESGRLDPLFLLTSETAMRTDCGTDGNHPSLARSEIMAATCAGVVFGGALAARPAATKAWRATGAGVKGQMGGVGRGVVAGPRQVNGLGRGWAALPARGGARGTRRFMRRATASDMESGAAGEPSSSADTPSPKLPCAPGIPSSPSFCLTPPRQIRASPHPHTLAPTSTLTPSPVSDSRRLSHKASLTRPPCFLLTPLTPSIPSTWSIRLTT
jgi:hypothetical protein